MQECDEPTLPTGSMKEIKEALRRHGEETGSTAEATRQWRAGRSIRGGDRRGEHVQHRTLDEEEE